MAQPDPAPRGGTRSRREFEPEAARPNGVALRLSPLLVFGLLALVTVLVWREQVSQNRALVMARTQDVAVQASRRAQILVDAGLTAASVFARRWSTHSERDFSHRRFREFASILVAQVPGICDVRLIPPGGGPGWRAREDIESSWSQMAETQAWLMSAAREKGGAVLSAPVTVGPNRTRFFAAMPLRRHLEPLGVLAVEFDSASLIDDGFHSRLRSEFSFEVSDGGTLLYAYTPDHTSPQLSPFKAVQDFPVHNRTWRFMTSPRGALLAGVGWWSSISVQLLGFALSAVLSGLLHVVLRRMHLYRLARDRALAEVAERKRAQEALRVSEARYRSVFDSANEGLLVVSDDDCIVEANPVACTMHGYELDQLNGLSIREIIAEDCRHSYEEFKLHRAQHGTVRLDSTHVRADGARFDVEVSATTFCHGEKPRILVTVTDVTERQKTVQRLAQLSRKTLMAQEEERSRVSRELHDELGQILTAAQLELGWLKKQSASNGGSLQKAVARSVSLVEQAAEELRHICRGLRPRMLDDIGLEPAVSQLVREFEKRSSTKTKVQLSLDDDESVVTVEGALCIYRVLQESLNNVSRHAQASRVSILLGKQADTVVLKVQDDGQGFDPDAVDGSRGCGLEGMRERANLVAGHLEIESVVGKGTQVVLTVPSLDAGRGAEPATKPPTAVNALSRQW